MTQVPYPSSAHKESVIGPLKMAHTVGAATVTHKNLPMLVKMHTHKPRTATATSKTAATSPSKATFVEKTWNTVLHVDKEVASHNHVMAKTTSEKETDTTNVSEQPIASQSADGKMTVQVVIDRVGHGIAPDPPVLTPQLAPLEDSPMSVQSLSDSSQTYEWKHEESMELAIVGAVVLVVAMVVIAFARRQQRAFEAQQQHQEHPEHRQTGTDLENGATTAAEQEQDQELDVGTPDSEPSPQRIISDEHVSAASPDSVVEGCV